MLKGVDMKKPLISFLCPSYNHERFVKYFLESLISQTNPNWELIIVDDHSTDNNVREIEKYKDSRIKLIENPFNMGINCGLNKAFELSKGQYISFCASDDMLRQDYIENVFMIFDNNPDTELLYCDLQVIDNDNKPIDKIIRNPKSDRYTVLNKLFMQENCMLSPGMVIKRELFKKILPLDIPMSQYQDYKMHIDLLLQSDFVVLDKLCVLYRKADDQSGLSAFNEITTRRRHLEENLLMDSFLKIQDPAVLQRIFTKELESFGTVTKEMIPFVLGNLAMKSREKYKKIWGYNQISRFINVPENYILLHRAYGFSYKEFLGLATRFEKDPAEIKYKKYKGLFNKLLVVTICLVAGLIISLCV